MGKIEYGVALGKKCSGKTIVSAYLEKNLGMKLVSVDEVQKALKEKLPDELKEDEGYQIPVKDIEAEITNILSAK